MANEEPELQKAAAKGADVCDLSRADWLMNPSCQAVFAALEAGGYAARAVGGAVRNSLMGIDVADVDIATPALPDVVMQLCSSAGMSVHETGIAHGTLTVVSNDVPFEVTTLRRDVATDGRRATVAFSEDWTEDAARRDFTMNAIYCDRHGKIHDPLDGLGDLKARRVRFIGSARQRIKEDYLRILRFFRFFATYGRGSIDGEGLEACIAERQGLRSLSSERIGSELLKLMVAPRSLDALSQMQRSGIDAIVTGRPANLELFAKFVALESELGVTCNPIYRLAALFTTGVKDARSLASRLRLSNAERQQLILAADPAYDARFASEAAQKIALYELGHMAYRSSCLIAWARSSAEIADDEFRSVFELPERWQPTPMPFKGQDVISRGIPPGPQVGQILRQFEDWWMASGFPAEPAILDEKFSDLIAAARKS